MAHDMVLNQALKVLIGVFDKEEEYKNYLINREKGFRKEAFQHLNGKLQKCCERGNVDEKIFYWAGKYLYRMDYIRKSLEINPNYDDARLYIIKIKLDRLWFATHHLPDYYCKDGEEQEDLKLCEVTQNEIEKIVSEEKREYLFKKLYFYKELIENYIEWKKSSSLTFEEWGKENNRKVDSGVISIYYQE